MRKHIANSYENRTYRYEFFVNAFDVAYSAWLDAPANTPPFSELDDELDRLTHILDGIDIAPDVRESFWDALVH